MGPFPDYIQDEYQMATFGITRDMYNYLEVICKEQRIWFSSFAAFMVNIE